MKRYGGTCWLLWIKVNGPHGVIFSMNHLDPRNYNLRIDTKNTFLTIMLDYVLEI